MKLYEAGRAPNPRRVRIFLAEKGLPIPESIAIDLAKLEQKAEAFAAINPWTRTPVLVLDDGTAIAETVAICRYFEELHPEPDLFGRGARERAEIEMWNRRMELGLFFYIGNAFRHLHPAMAEMEKPQIAAWGEACKGHALDQIALVEGRLAASPFIAGARFTIADITGGIALDMLRMARIELPQSAVHIRRWHDGLKARASWTA
jgi:glutathione S-transferase